MTESVISLISRDKELAQGVYSTMDKSMKLGNAGILQGEEVNYDLISSRLWENMNVIFELISYIWTVSPHLSAVTEKTIAEASLPEYKAHLYGSHGERTASLLLTDMADTVSQLMEDFDEMHLTPSEDLPSFDVDTSNCHAGFCKLKPWQPDEQQEQNYVFTITENNPSFSTLEYKQLSQEIITHSFVSVNDQPRIKSNPNLQDFYTINDIGPGSNVICSTSSALKQSLDITCGVGTIPWPADARYRKTRPRQSGWPSQEVVEEIINLGCFLVAKPHPSSTDPQNEFRFSFSEAERTLIRNLDRWQKNCYMIVKLLCKQAFRGYKLLSSYHVKTMFLWMLEEYPLYLWSKERIGEMACLLLDKIILAFAKGNIPSYFIPSNNLIDHLSRDHLKICLGILKKIRQDPLLHALNLLEYEYTLLYGNSSGLYRILETEKELNLDCELLKDFMSVIVTLHQLTVKKISHVMPSLSYQPLIELFVRSMEIQYDLTDDDWANIHTLLKFQDCEIDPPAYQYNLHNDIDSMFCALGSHYRVQYLITAEKDQKAALFAKSKKLFEKSMQGLQLPYDFVIAEYAAFLLDAGLYDESSHILERPMFETVDEYKHFAGGHGYFEVETKYFIPWLKFNLALVKGETGDDIIQEYEEMVKDQDEMNYSMEDDDITDTQDIQLGWMSFFQSLEFLPLKIDKFQSYIQNFSNEIAYNAPNHQVLLLKLMKNIADKRKGQPPSPELMVNFGLD